MHYCSLMSVAEIIQSLDELPKGDLQAVQTALNARLEEDSESSLLMASLQESLQQANDGIFEKPSGETLRAKVREWAGK